jgi:anthraniloyl-CoA monooxygenase
MATYSTIEGLVQDFRLVHLGARAQVMVEMTAPSPDGRITPASTGLWADAQGLAYQCIVALVHASSQGAKIGLQLGHSGPKGSTRVGWDRADEPLAKGNWPPLAAKPVCNRTDQTPFADRVRNEVGVQTMAVGTFVKANPARTLQQVAQ